MKKYIFYGFILAFNFLVIEGISYGFYQFKYGDYALYTIQHSKLNAIDSETKGSVYTVGEESTDNIIRKKIVHPYYGYTTDGKQKRDKCVSNNIEDCYDRIKTHTDKPLPKRSNDKVIVGVFGGSFALGTVNGTGHIPFYKLLLSRLPKFSGKEIVVLSFADGGFKQPQHLMRLNYLYSQGAEFDIVINIDGFNEMSVAFFGYDDNQVHPSFPQSWSGFMQSALTPELLDAYSQKKTLLYNHARFAKLLLTEGVRYSPTLNLIWRIKDDNQSVDIANIGVKLLKNTNNSKRDFRYQEVGPDYNYIDKTTLHRDSANTWAKSSILMKAAVEINGGQYFHFLQPNQHIEGSKVLSAEEQKNAYSPNAGYGGIYKQSHQYLLEKIPSIKSNDVNFFDLTYQFKNNPDTLYIDNCCHMNYKGYGLVVTEIIQLIAPMLAKNTVQKRTNPDSSKPQQP